MTSSLVVSKWIARQRIMWVPDLAHTEPDVLFSVVQSLDPLLFFTAFGKIFLAWE